MKKIGYTFLISVITIILFLSYLYLGNVDSEMLYTVGIISMVILYFLIGYPTLLIIINKPLISTRIARYALASLIGTVIFILFYIKIGQLDNDEILYILIPYSFLFGTIGGIMFFLPVELVRTFKKKEIS